MIFSTPCLPDTRIDLGQPLASKFLNILKAMSERPIENALFIYGGQPFCVVFIVALHDLKKAVLNFFRERALRAVSDFP